MRLLALGGIVFLMGAWFGFYEAHAASGVKYDAYLYGKNAAKMTPDTLNGYMAGNYDTMVVVTWMANERPQLLSAESLTKQLQCLQRIPSAQEAAAWAKDVWAANPEYPAALTVFAKACDYNTGARTTTTTKTGGLTHSGTATFTILK